MSTSSEQITDLIGGYTDLKSYFEGQRDGWDSRVAAKESEVDAFLLSARNEFRLPWTMKFDETVLHSKTSLNLAADPSNAAQTIWTAISVSPTGANLVGFSAANYFAALHLARNYSFAPGFYENPEYNTDWSRTQAEFVIAGANATSEEINAALAVSGADPNVPVLWGFGTVRGEIPIVAAGGTDGTLFARFRNRVYGPSGSAQPAQNVTNFGGNAVFAVDRVTIFLR